jgi:hypothetical protein
VWILANLQSHYSSTAPSWDCPPDTGQRYPVLGQWYFPNYVIAAEVDNPTSANDEQSTVGYSIDDPSKKLVKAF